MKTTEELDTLKEEVETLSRKLRELSDEELEQVGCIGLGFISCRAMERPIIDKLK